MSAFGITLKTLDQARGSIRPPRVRGKRQLPLLKLLPEGVYRSLPELARLLEVEANSLSATVGLMRGKNLLERIGDAGDYRYTSTALGRSLLQERA